MQTVLASQNVVITQNLNGINGQFSKNINVSFLPDEMVVKYITYFNNNAEVNVSVLRCDLVNEGVIGAFVDTNSTQNIDASFKVNRQPSGAVNFSINSVTGALVPGRTGDLAVHLQFIKYNDDKQRQYNEVVSGKRI